MKFEILTYIPDEKGYRKGFVDFKVIYNPDKWETFRNVTYLEKERKRWLDIGSIQRDGMWVKRYERKPDLSVVFREFLHTFHPSEDN